MNNNIPIKSVYAALYTLLQAVPLPAGIGAKKVTAPQNYAFQRTSRRAIDWDQVAAGDMPFALQHAGPIEAEQRSVFQLPTFTMRAYWWIYFRADAAIVDNNPPDDIVQDIFDAINNTLQGPAAGERQTLAGTIYHAWSEGCFFEPAVEDNQVLMMVPIIMRTGV